MPKRAEPVRDRFFRKFVVSDSGCWEWSGLRHRSGYGHFTLPGHKKVRAHRLSYELHKGPIPDGLFVLHRCDNPPCVNPEHLWLGTAKDNLHDAIKKGRWKVGTCEKGPNSRLTPDAVAHIRRRELTAVEYGELYGVWHTTVQNIWLGRTWVSDESQRYKAKSRT